MYETYETLNFTRIGVINKDLAWDEYILVNDPEWRGLLTDPDNPNLNEYFGEKYCYSSGQQFCDYISLYKENNEDDKLIVVVHHQLDV